MLSRLSAALGFGGRGSSEEAAAAAEGASSSGNGSDSHAPAPDAPATMANRDSSGSSWLSSGATTPLEWTASSAEGRGLALPQGLPRLVFLPVSDSATVSSAAGAAATAEEAMDVDHRHMSHPPSSVASHHYGGHGLEGAGKRPVGGLEAHADVLGPGSAPVPYATLAQRRHHLPMPGEDAARAGGDDAALLGEPAVMLEEPLPPPPLQQGGVEGGETDLLLLQEQAEPMEAGGAVAFGGGGGAMRGGLRRSYSYSNLHDRSASLDRPSVNQCIRAIGFLLEHMMREDSYRERSPHYDFSRPRRRRRRRRGGEKQRQQQVMSSGGSVDGGALGSLATYKRGRGEAGARAGRAPGRRRRGTPGTGSDYYGQEDDRLPEGEEAGGCDSTDDEARPYGGPFALAVGRDGEGSSFDSAASSVSSASSSYMGMGMMAEGGEEVVSEDVADFLHRVYSLCKWTPECNIMALILVIRLCQYNPDMTLHPGNWRRLLLTALMIAQKTWDDRALRNKDFPQIWAAVTHCGGAHAPGGETAGVGEEPGISLEETNAMERAFLTRLDHQLFIAPATYASTYFELCSLVPSHASEEALRRQLHRMTELAGANVRVVLRQQPAPHHDGHGGLLHPDGGMHPHHPVGGGGGGGPLAYNTAEVIYSGEGGGR